MLKQQTTFTDQHGLLQIPPLPEGQVELDLTENSRQVLTKRYVRRGPDGQPVESI